MAVGGNDSSLKTSVRDYVYRSSVHGVKAFLKEMRSPCQAVTMTASENIISDD